MRLVRMIAIALALASGHADAQEKETLKRIQANPTPAEQRAREARTLFAHGLMQLREESILGAVSSLESARALDPDAAAIQRELVPVYAKLGRASEALKAAQHAAAADPDDYETRYQLANLHTGDAAWGEAKSALQNALKSKHLPAVPERHFVLLRALTSLHERLADYEQAIDSQKRLIALFDEHRERLLTNGIFTEERIRATRAEAYERLGKLHRECKRFPEALTAYRQAHADYAALKDETERVRAVRLSWNLCELAHGQGHYQEALTHVDAYLAQAPMETAPFDRKAQILQALGRKGEVLPFLEQSLAQQTHHAGLQLLVARELGRVAGRKADAIARFDELMNRASSVEPAREFVAICLEWQEPQRIIERLDDLCQKALPERDGYTPALAAARQQLLFLGQAYRQNRQAVNVVIARLINEAPGAAPRHPFLYQTVGASAHQFDRLDEAVILLERAHTGSRERNDLRPAIARALADCYREKRAWARLSKFVQEQLDQAPTPNEILVYRLLGATALSQLDQPDAALAMLAPATAAANYETRNRFDCTRVEILKRAGRLDDARTECEALLKKALLNAEIYAIRLIYAQVLQNRNEHAAAEEQLRAALELAPNDPLILNNLGYFLAERGEKLEEAEQLIRQALAEDRKQGVERQAVGLPVENGHYLDSLGWVLYRRGKWKEAHELLKRAVQMYAEQGELWEHLGDVQKELKLTTEARQSYDKALELYERDPEARREKKPELIRKKRP
jgi:tetratricopeptide (TPR) repeat protein